MIRIAALVAGLAIASGAAPAQEPQLARMGTASVAGVYFPVGVALCRLVNLQRRSHGIRCSALPTEGSVANISALRDAEIELALVQSDLQAAALAGDGAFAGEPPFDDLRALFGLYPEALTIVARSDAGVAGLADLEGKRISAGTAGSGGRALWEAVMTRQGWTEDSFAATPDIAPGDLARALCEDRIDAFALAVGHPSPAVQETTTECDATLVSPAGAPVDALVAETPELVRTEIPGGLYRGSPDPVPSFGVVATLVTRADVPEAQIRTMVAGMFDRIEMLRGLHPVLADLDPEAMVAEGLIAPLHPGAAAYFRDAGLTPD